MRFEGRAHKLGANVSTDEIAPSRKTEGVTDEKELGKALMANTYPELVGRIQPGDVLVALENFGMGSSRGTAPLAVRGAGISCIVAVSIARTFHRNCLNEGVPAVVCPQAARAARDGDPIVVDLEAGTVAVRGQEFRTEPFPPFLMELLEHGGLVGWAKTQLSR